MAEGAPASEEGGFWVKTLAKGASTAGAILAAICGIFVLLSFSGKCIAMGIYMVAGGVGVLMLEATVCFMFLDIGKWLASKSDMIKNWQKMFLYFALCIPAVAVCGSASSWIGSIGFLVAGMSYMVMTIGPKGQRVEGPAGNSSVPYGRQIDDVTNA